MSEIDNHTLNLMTFSPLRPAKMGNFACEYEYLIRHSSSLDALLHTGALVADAVFSLQVPQRDELRDRMGWDQETFDDYIRIGVHTGLQCNDVYPYLPPSFSVLALIVRTPWDQVEEAIREGVIHPQMHVRSLANWLKEYKTSKRRRRRPKPIHLTERDRLKSSPN